jgi:hypothetical protein
VPTRRDRIPVTKDPELAAALERVAALVPPGVKPAALVHDLAVRGADASLVISGGLCRRRLLSGAGCR